MSWVVLISVYWEWLDFETCFPQLHLISVKLKTNIIVNLSGSEAILRNWECTSRNIIYVIECSTIHFYFPGSMMISWILDNIISNTCKESLFSFLFILVLSDNYLFLVICGALIAKKISVRMVTLIGALIFLGFAVASLFIDPYEENHLVPDVEVMLSIYSWF